MIEIRLVDKSIPITNGLLSIKLSYDNTTDIDAFLESMYDNATRQALLGIADKLAVKDGGHNKFLEAINVVLCIKAPRYWWQECSTYRVGTTTSSQCYDSETEVLTNNGWKLFKNLTTEDKVCTINLKTRNIEYQLPTSYLNEVYKGKLISFNSRSVDLLVTPNHKMIVKGRRSDNLRFVEASNFTHNNAIPKRGVWLGKDKEEILIPKVLNHLGSEDVRVDIDIMLKFLGIFISEGHLTKSNGSYIIGVSQSIESKYFNDINQLFSEFPFKSNLLINNKEAKWIIYSKQLYTYLEDQKGAVNKYIPSWVLSLSIEKLSIIEEWLMKGDGSIANGHYIYISTSKKLIDNMQELWIKLGYGTSITNHCNKQGNRNKTWCVCRHKTDYAYIIKDEIKEVNYNGNIYCVEVPNSTLLVRRNGKACWCGNSTMHTLKKRPLSQDDFASPIQPEYLDFLNELISSGASKVEIKNALPEGFMQMRVVALNYKVLRNMYSQRKNHELQEWKDFCAFIVENLPHSNWITG